MLTYVQRLQLRIKWYRHQPRKQIKVHGLLWSKYIHIEWTTISSNRYLATCNFGPYFPFQQSTLLMALLGELPTQSGTSILRGRVGYTAQQAWILNGSLRDNILFGSEYQPAKYQRVIRLCALSRVGVYWELCITIASIKITFKNMHWCAVNITWIQFCAHNSSFHRVF